jgi:hypothetical protein
MVKTLNILPEAVLRTMEQQHGQALVEALSLSQSDLVERLQLLENL